MKTGFELANQKSLTLIQYYQTTEHPESLFISKGFSIKSETTRRDIH